MLYYLQDCGNCKISSVSVCLAPERTVYSKIPRPHWTAICGENERCWFSCWMALLFVSGASASSSSWRPVAFAFLTLCLVLLTGLVALLALCKYCGVPSCWCGSEFQMCDCFCSPWSLTLLSLYPNGNNMARRGNSPALLPAAECQRRSLGITNTDTWNCLNTKGYTLPNVRSKPKLP